MNEITIPYDLLKEFCKKNKIKKLALYGSIIRDEYKPDVSDLDLLVEFFQGKHPSLFNFAGMEIELSEMLNKKVDLRTKEDLSIYFRDQVLNDAKMIFESE